MTEPWNDQTGWEAELFRLLVENSKDYAVFVIDTEGRVQTWNHGAERVLGYQAEEIVGKSSFITFTPEDRQQNVPEKELQIALSEGRAGDDRWHLRKDGTRLWVNGAMILLKDARGNVRGLAKVMRDFTDAKLAADALRESEGRLRVALDAADMGTWLWRIPTDEQILDESLRRLMGLRPEDAVRSLDDFLQAVHNADRVRVRAEFERCRLEEGTFNVEFRVVWPDGSLHWLRDQGKLFADQDGHPLFMTGACVDITDRKHAEDELKEADRKKDEFLALLAHELRNPLAPLRNGLQVMRLASDDRSIGRARAMMDRQLGHMVRLIDDLLDVSRLSQNKLHLQKSRVMLADVIGSAVETARPAIEAAGHELTVSIPSEPVFLDADPTRLAQVFSNLLTNSAKYTEKGGHVRLTVERVDHHVVITVQDTGIGIPADALPTIFDMFSQVDRSIERATGGLGIGLALVKGLVEMHGGTVRAESDGQGQGSTFTVTLPAPGEREGPAHSPPDEGGEATGPVRRMLVVDDNGDSAESMAMMLSLLGHEVHMAHDGIDAMEQAKAFRPDIILMDVGMPRLNGLDEGKEPKAYAGASGPGTDNTNAGSGARGGHKRRMSSEAKPM